MSTVDDLQFVSSSSSSSSSLPPPPLHPITSTSSNPLSTTLSHSSHPSQIILHLLFKSTSIIFYLINPSSDFVMTFVIIILLLSADFYVTKNLTGRKLAKLRWWAEVDETTGANKWSFECLDQNDASVSVNKTDVSFFWTVLYIYPAIWTTFLVLALIRFKFEWCLLDFVGVALATANLVGYTKCDKEKRKRWGRFAEAADGGVFGGAARGAFVDAVFKGGLGGYENVANSQL